MNLVQEYLELANQVVLFNEYENMKAVKEHNRKMTRMRKIATEIETNYPTLKNEFCELLSHKSDSVRLLAAHHVLEVMNCDNCYRKSALQEITHHANIDKTVSDFGNRIWLEDWYKSHPQDRFI
ncbi:MAG: hypothetical protein UD936_00775 [Acutalibacteraceae bacterium]|nr:hypothetical protein [Acutalibacteraceae bacterium]